MSDFKSSPSSVSGDLTVDTETLYVDSTNNRVGIGTTSPDYTLEVANPSGAGMYTIIASDTTAMAAGVGGGITFRGVYNAGTSLTEFATIRAAKSNGTVTNYDADLVFLTRANGSGDSTEHMRIDSSGNVGIGTASPNANAILDLTSTTKPFMPPRMTEAERDAVSDPTAGMVIYNSDTNVLNFHNGSAWGAV